MFATHSALKFPIQLPGDDSTTWHGVEVVLDTPWVICTLFEQVEEVSRKFLVSDQDVMVQMASPKSGAKLEAIHLVLPPRYSTSHEWEILPIAALETLPPEGRRALGHPVLTTRDGVHYTGFPLEPASGPVGPLTTLARFADVGASRPDL